MTYQLTGHIRKQTNTQLLADLRNAAAQIGQTTISNQQYRQIGNYYPTIYIRRFTTWNNALRKAGLTVSREYNVTIPQLFSNIQKLWQHLGHQPTLANLYPPHSQYSRRPYLRQFGTWKNALLSFVKQTTNQPPASETNPESHFPLHHTPPSAPSSALNHRNTLNPNRTRHSAQKGYKTVTWRLRHLIMKRDNFRCLACGATPATNPSITLNIDHIIPTSKGGTSNPENLQTLCTTCNIGKSNL